MSKPKISFVIPTHNRRGRTLQTLRLLARNVGRLPHEAIVVDNASSDGTVEALAREFPEVRRIELDTNLNTAARNLGLAAAESEFVFMLDDDSWPQTGTAERALQVMAELPRLAAAACYVRRPGESVRHEAGGLPGVFLGGGVVLRKGAIQQIGGYPIDYGYYVEEYDLCARLWQADWQVRWFDSLLAWHDPDAGGRDMNRILKMLTANNLRFWSRYAPTERHDDLIEETIDRYRRIAAKESSLPGYQEGLAIGLHAAAHNSTRRRPLSAEQFDRLYGLDHLRRRLQQTRAAGLSRLVLWRRGKAAEQIVEAAEAVGVKIVALAADANSPVGAGPLAKIPVCRPEDIGQVDAQAVLAGSLSPGASLDLLTEARAQAAHLPVLDPVARSVREAVMTAA